MDRFFVGAALAGLSAIGINTAPIMHTTDTIVYPVTYESQVHCEDQLKHIKNLHNITHLTCKPNG